MNKLNSIIQASFRKTNKSIQVSHKTLHAKVRPPSKATGEKQPLSGRRATPRRSMQIQVNTDSSIEGSDKLTSSVSRVVESALNRFNDQITRVEVHLHDQNGVKNGQNDKRCTMEARVKGLQPTAVTHVAGTLNEAVDGAAGKIRESIESTLGRLHDKS